MSTPALPASELIPNPRQKNWFGRHRVAAVCLGLCAVVLVGALFVGGVLVSVRSLMLHAEPAQMALARAVKNPQVVQRLGSPMRPGWFVTGNIHLNNDSGEADLEIPLIGQHGRAEIHVVAQKEFGRWQYKKMIVGSEDSDQVIDLLAPEPGIGKR